MPDHHDLKDAQKRRGALADSLGSLQKAHAPIKARPALGRAISVTKRLLHKAKARIRRIRAAIRRRRGGPDRALAEALHFLGAHETPDGSNDGHPVRDFWTFIGYTSPVPWCGCFVGYCQIKGGHAKITSRIRFGYGPYLIADARAGRNGMHAIALHDVEPGDGLVYWGGEHVGMAAGRYDGSGLATVEGNTSPSAGGSQYDGGVVARKYRTASDVTVAIRFDY